MDDTEGSRRYTKRVIHKPGDWEKLSVLDPTSPHLAGQLFCLRLLRKNLSPETPLIQTIFNPLSQAKNLAGNETLLAHLREEPEAVMKGLDTIAKTTSKFIEAAREIGIDGIFYAIQHAQAELLELNEYKTLGLPYDQAVLESTDDLWCNMLHLHGKDVFFSLLRLFNFQIVNWHDRETYPSLAEAQSLFRGTLCGGLRQDTLVFEDQAKVKEEAEDAIRQTKGHRFHPRDWMRGARHCLAWKFSGGDKKCFGWRRGMSLRVISGTARGRKLKSVPGDTTRPVMDRVKEALFNILAGDVIDSNWWDLFGGTGAIGIEALSRGAAFVRFSDLNRAPVETIKENVEHCGFAKQAEIRKGDAFSMLSAQSDRKFEFIYIAPPQYQEMWIKALKLADEHIGWLADDGTVIVQIDPTEYQEIELKNLEETEQRKYGSTLIIFYDRVE